jgi:uncharacterized protein
MADFEYPLPAFIRRLPSATVLALFGLYHRAISPVATALAGPGCGCRFVPTCSHYGAEAVRVHGALAGMGLALRRLAKCSPLNPGGFDPVPPKRRCVRSAEKTGVPAH